MENSDQEEADSRIAHHVVHILENGGEFTLIVTGGTDVVVVMCGQVRDISRP
jgi:hypothetical protein